MTLFVSAMRYLLSALIFAAFLFTSVISFAQCNNWSTSVTNIKPSDCIANGSFTILLSGSDVANLSNVKYSIPLTQGGFSVQPNSSANFTSIPPGTYTVKTEADCATGSVVKYTNATITGAYIAPSLVATQERGSLSCGKYGQIRATMTGSSYPYSIKLLSYPGAYTGPATIVSSTTNKLLDSLPAGVYVIQVADTCGTATPTQTVTISSLNVAAAPIAPGGYTKGTTCNKITIFEPGIDLSNDPAWKGYYLADTLFEAAVEINGLSPVTPYVRMGSYSSFSITLPAGKTLKDLMGTTYTFHIKPPCGPIFTVTGTFGNINVKVNKITKCNTGFVEEIDMTGALICYPVTFSIKNTSTNVTYGPFVSNSSYFTSPLLPFGTYDITYTTADGYSGNTTVSGNAPSQNPYYVFTYTDNYGINGHISGFNFSYSGGGFPSGTIIKLVNGPAGYVYDDTIHGNPSSYQAAGNMAMVINNNKYFIPGNYTWQIKDVCGTYIVNCQVAQSQVYNYTLNLGNRQQTCNGLKVYPAGTCTYNNINNHPVFFKILSGPVGYNGSLIAAGNAMVLNITGTYVVGIAASAVDVYPYWNTFPNAYQVTDTIVYDHKPLTVDINNTQGFLCIGALPGQGQIVVKGVGGIAYKAPATHYKFSLAVAGNGANGPYISNNTTGHFSALGMNADDIYDVKIEDSCGAYVVQQVKILDLATAQLASASPPVVCEGESLYLYSLPFPSATYAWTGPNSFSSALQNPVINKTTVAGSGTYTVTITTPYCNTPVSSSLAVLVNPAPGKAGISVNCIDTTAVMTATNVAGATYQWYQNGGTLAGETNVMYTVTTAGSYYVRTLFSSTGCSTSSDTIIFSASPGYKDTPVIVSTHTVLCKDDTAILAANTKYPGVSYQWYRNSIPLAGMTSSTLVTVYAGDYTVKVSTGPCSNNTSASVYIQKLVPPANIVPLGDTVFCEGEYVMLDGIAGMGLSYVWKRDGMVIPQAYSSNYKAMQTGTYTLDVYNGYCTSVSNTVQVKVHQKPVAAISPEGEVYICEGEYVQLVNPTGQGYRYSWLKDKVVIPGETSNALNVSAAGVYIIIVSNDECPDDTATVNIYTVPMPLADITVNGPTAFCEGLSTWLKLPYQHDYTYQWYKDGQPLAFANSAVYEASLQGSYHATVTHHHCSTTSKMIDIVVHPLPLPLITRREAVLNTGIYTSYQWLVGGWGIPGETKQIHQLVQSGYYTVKVTDSNGCAGISLPFDVVSTEEGCIVRLPSAFSPNNDGKNDVFRLISMDDFDLKELMVLNRWGQVVFSTTNVRAGWDGTYKGTAQEIGTYFYMVRYKCNNETQPRLRKGDVILTR